MKYIIILHKNNREYLVESYPNLSIETDENTKDNIIHIGENVQFISKSELLLRGIRGNFWFMSNSVFEDIQVRTGPGCFEQNLYIGSNCYFEKGTEIVLNNDFCSCNIGDGCHFQRNVEVWTGDGHAIINKYNMHANNCENYSVDISDGVLIGHNSVILKRAKIAGNSIVRSNSVVTKDFSGNSCLFLAGIPARVIEENVIWKER